jgi:membrane protease YdiL (CAAX protease family)
VTDAAVFRSETAFSMLAAWRVAFCERGWPPLAGSLWPLLPGVLVAAVANAAAEEYVFRGVVQPAFIRAGGVAAGRWMQGLMFGLMHWGMSVGVLAALPVSLLIGFGSVVWGKAALDTLGMG